jgi:hypothetical protein
MPYRDTYMTYSFLVPGEGTPRTGQASQALMNPSVPTLEEIRTLMAEIGLPEINHNVDIYHWATRPSRVHYAAMEMDVFLGYNTVETPKYAPGIPEEYGDWMSGRTPTPTNRTEN